jgi:cellulose synthase/poly-beta-1,6-N-acetylglucosamine synthase-like glycosyltransferase
MKASVIFSTYNAEAWLEKVVIGFSVQTIKDFEIIIADDGSGEKTKQLIERLKSEIMMPIKHVWQEDDGFQKTKILNKAILAAETDYLIFTDGDCIPRNDFVATHLKYREEGYFLSGGYFKLPMDISELISKEDIISQKCFQVKWLKSNGLKPSVKNLKLTNNGSLSAFLNKITPTTPSWNGHNASGWKKDLLAINGFNQEMQYGGEDRELGERLMNFGIKSKQIRYSAICVHLDHARGYVNQAAIDKNIAIRKDTLKNKVVKTTHGIDSNVL